MAYSSKHKQTKQKMVSFRCREEDYKKIDELAKHSGKKRSKYMLDKILKKETDSTEIYMLLRSVSEEHYKVTGNKKYLLRVEEILEGGGVVMQGNVSDVNRLPLVIVKFATDQSGRVMKTYKRERDIERVVKYICKDKMSGRINMDYVGGNGVSLTDHKKAARDIKRFQKKVGKESGRRLYHLIISFDYEKNPQTVYEVVERICDKFFSDYQYIFNVHTDCKHLHAHICIGSVGICVPHKKIHFSKKEGAALIDGMKDLAIELLNPDFRANFYRILLKWRNIVEMASAFCTHT